MEFKYIGMGPDKKIVKGTVTAANEDMATKLLINRDYRLYSLKAVSPFMPDMERLFPSFYKIKPEMIILFSRQLALLLESGTDIITAMELLRNQSKHAYFKKILGQIISDIRGGSKLSASLSKYDKVFSRVFIQTVGIGERSGNMEQMLREVADYMENDVKTGKQIKGALTYPIIVSVVAFIVVGILVIFVLPKFTDLYKSLGAQVPTFTKIMLSVFEWVSHFGIYIMAVIAALFILVYAYTLTLEGRLTRDRIILKIPLLGQVSHLSELVRSCRSISILYKAGLPLIDILTLVIENCGNLVIKNALAQVQLDVLAGKRLSESMVNTEAFLPMMVQMVSVGENTGNLDVTLLATAKNFETEASDRTKALVGAIQPALTLGIAIFVGLIAISMVTAMYSVYGQIM